MFEVEDLAYDERSCYLKTDIYPHLRLTATDGARLDGTSFVESCQDLADAAVRDEQLA